MKKHIAKIKLSSISALLLLLGQNHKAQAMMESFHTDQINHLESSRSHAAGPERMPNGQAQGWLGWGSPKQKVRLGDVKFQYDKESSINNERKLTNQNIIELQTNAINKIYSDTNKHNEEHPNLQLPNVNFDNSTATTNRNGEQVNLDALSNDMTPEIAQKNSSLLSRTANAIGLNRAGKALNDTFGVPKAEGQKTVWNAPARGVKAAYDKTFSGPTDITKVNDSSGLLKSINERNTLESEARENLANFNKKENNNKSTDPKNPDFDKNGTYTITLSSGKDAQGNSVGGKIVRTVYAPGRIDIDRNLPVIDIDRNLPVNDLGLRYQDTYVPADTIINMAARTPRNVYNLPGNIAKLAGHKDGKIMSGDSGSLRSIVTNSLPSRITGKKAEPVIKAGQSVWITPENQSLITNFKSISTDENTQHLAALNQNQRTSTDEFGNQLIDVDVLDVHGNVLSSHKLYTPATDIAALPSQKSLLSDKLFTDPSFNIANGSKLISDKADPTTQNIIVTELNNKSEVRTITYDKTKKNILSIKFSNFDNSYTKKIDAQGNIFESNVKNGNGETQEYNAQAKTTKITTFENGKPTISQTTLANGTIRVTKYTDGKPNRLLNFPARTVAWILGKKNTSVNRSEVEVAVTELAEANNLSSQETKNAIEQIVTNENIKTLNNKQKSDWFSWLTSWFGKKLDKNDLDTARSAANINNVDEDILDEYIWNNDELTSGHIISNANGGAGGSSSLNRSTLDTVGVDENQDWSEKKNS